MPAELVFVYFVGDADMQGPASRHKWQGAVSAVHEQLGITGRMPPYVRDVFVDVGQASGQAMTASQALEAAMRRASLRARPG